LLHYIIKFAIRKNTKNNLEFDINVIEESLLEKNQLCGGFLCEYEFFKRQFQLKKRASQRDKSSNQICLVSITDKKGNLPPQKRLNVVMTEIIDAIRLSLRASDMFSRFSVSQYVIMLADASYNNAKMVLDRIQHNCSKYAQNSDVHIKCDLKDYC